MPEHPIPAGEPEEIDDRRWFATRRVGAGETLRVTIGPLTLWLARRPHEWRISHLDGGDSLAEPVELDGPRRDLDPDAKAVLHRFALSAPGERIRLRPRLADRPVVARPEPQLVVPPGDQVELFVSTPLWVAIELPDPPRPLFEIPMSRPSDTWLGPDTRYGTACYASKTAARLLLENIPRRPHRAITRVTVKNRADDPLALERLSVPAPTLTLYADAEGALWTQSVTAVRERGGLLRAEGLVTEPPPELVAAEVVALPRHVGTPTVLHRALQVLLG